MQSITASGFLLIDKPAGISSFDVIRHLRKQTGIRTYGHAGTLDPFATGLLIIAVNKYTRLLSLLDNATKSYTATMVLGSVSTTGDPEGEITVSGDEPLATLDMNDLKTKVLNITSLKPPIHSAIKVDGKRAYTRARALEDFELPERDSTIHEFEILSFEYPNMTYSCRVSKGTYVRSLSEKIAEFLGTIAYTNELRRTSIGKISLDRAISLVDITDESIEVLLSSIHDIIPELESLILNEEEIKRIRNGNSIPNIGIDNNVILLLDTAPTCIGTGYRKENILYPKVNLC
jgi:tRNA pseudouridine55 synthase